MIRFTLNTKNCMTALLLQDTFHTFSFIEGEITTFARFAFDGYLQKPFYEEAPDREYALWPELQEFCLSIIKGKRTPLYFRFILALSREESASLVKEYGLNFQPSNIQGLYLNFHYDGTALTCTTGTSLKIFTTNKTLEQAWDQYARGLLAAYIIE